MSHQVTSSRPSGRRAGTSAGAFAAVLAVVLAVVAAGCASATSAAVAPQLIPAEEVADFALPPTGAALTATQADGSVITLSVADIEALGLVRVAVFEPFLAETVVFEGVPVGDVLAAAEFSVIEPVEMGALDDYRFTFDARSLEGSGGVIATRRGGMLLDLDAGGPLRLVFTENSPFAADKSAWIWSIDRFSPAG